MFPAMPKHAILVFSAAIFLLAAGFDFSTSTAQHASLTSPAERNAAIHAAAAEVLRETSEIRQLPILRPVRSGAQSRPAIERMVIKNLNENITNAEMHATEVSLRKFGLVPKDFSFRPFIIKLLTEQVAGYYDVKARQFYLADWLELGGQKPVMAHELTHALQDQHFNLRRFEKWPKADSDAEFAARALIEGDATLTMSLYMIQHPLEWLAFGRTVLTAGLATEQIDRAPRALRESLIFPYVEGSEWATEVYRVGGWNAVSAAYTKLPSSTEQILHPEKYFAGEKPIKISLPDMTALLNSNSKQQTNGSQPMLPAIGKQRSAVGLRQSQARRRLRKPVRKARIGSFPTRNPQLPNPSRWRRVDYDVNGEWGYYLILDEFLKSEAESKRAAAGWAGDRYAIYEKTAGAGEVMRDKTDNLFLTQLTAWDTENDASEFFEAYVKRAQLRYPDSTTVDSEVIKTEKGHYPVSSMIFTTSEGTVVIQRRGLRVLILEGIPNSIDLNLIIKASWL